MKIAMVDPSLFTGRYDDSLCRGLAAQGADVTLLGRPMRSTDAITPENYRYEPRFFRRSEALRARLGEGKAFRLIKAAEYGAACALGRIGALTAIPCAANALRVVSPCTISASNRSSKARYPLPCTPASA